MPKCAGCGEETELHELDVPICPACIADREGSRPSLATLRDELASARKRYRQAMAEFERQEAKCRGLPQGHPDRTIAARFEQEAKMAGETYWEALRVYSNAARRDSGRSP